MIGIRCCSTFHFSDGRWDTCPVRCDRFARLTDILLRRLDSAQVVVRGPKPATVLHSRKVRIDRAASDPFTTQEVLAAMHKIPLRGKRVVVQRYGETNGLILKL